MDVAMTLVMEHLQRYNYELNKAAFMYKVPTGQNDPSLVESIPKPSIYGPV
jgi:hypothetical protein